MACRKDIEKIILDEVDQIFVDGRHTYYRLDDNTFRIANTAETAGKSKAKTRNQAREIALSLRQAIINKYGNNIFVQVSLPEESWLPIELTVTPTPQYIEKLYAQVKPEKRTEYVSREAFLQDEALYQQELREDEPINMIPYEAWAAQNRAPNPILDEEGKPKFDTALSENNLITPTITGEGQLQLMFPTPIKPGVAELFESNPELADVVYEALGFSQSNVISSNYLFEQIIKNPESKDLKKIAELLNKSNIKNRQILLKDYDSVSPTHGQAVGFIEDKKIATNVAVTDFEYLSNVTTNEFDKEFFKNQSFQETLLHEELHRYTSYLLQVFNHYFEQTRNEADALKELKNYFENVLDKPNLEKEIEFIKEYNILYKIYQENGGTFNNREFITYGLTNPQEIKKLKNIKVGKSTLLDRMIKALFNLFSTPTLYDALYDTFSNYYLNFDSTKYKEFTNTVKLKLTPLNKNSYSITPQQKQQALQQYSQYLEQNPNGSIEGFKEFVKTKPTITPITQVPDVMATIIYQNQNCK